MLAFRFSIVNLLRQKRRTLITSLTLIAGLVAVNLFQGYQTDTVESLAETAAYGEMLGHLSVMKEGAMTKGKIDEIGYMLDGDQLTRALEMIRKDPDVAIAAARMNLSGLISNGKSSIIFIAVAIDPAVLAQFQKKFDWRGEGVPLAAGDVSDGQVAKGLAEIMEVKTGDFLTLFSTTVKNQMNAVDISIKATYPTGSTATDDKFVIMPLVLGQKLYRTQGAHQISVVLHDGVKLSEARARLAKQLSQLDGMTLKVKTFRELSAFFKGVEDIYNMIFGFLFLIVLVVVLMGVFNTMTMAAMERIREIGMLRALGMSPNRVRGMFGVEGLMLGFAAGIFASLASAVVAYLINHAGITYTPPGISGAVQLYIAFVPGKWIGNMIFLALLAGIVSIFPAQIAIRSQVVDALRHS
ncbi:MAG: ABC transporter permease [Rhodospirillaceae bacterium]|jgi:putative ABC transport system permease protein|nr:ABC transporter permease [Rhodospirillaceae bacterium]MBT3495096.1 ABC transporter permease [Rhodospirillaceae bacterium]MBT3782793.1 ABC transporter permease [Rhodospirillaceae bacterium]MBT4171114.1 ABC transporter permease [Rhodospirillaceae bacterium]MBT4561528.1 ABC transporter permease [Rhodospirillaceae bacterium]